MFNKEDYCKRLDAIRQRTPMSYLDLADAMGISYNTTRKLCDGNTKVNHRTWVKVKYYVEKKESILNNTHYEDEEWPL